MPKTKKSAGQTGQGCSGCLSLIIYVIIFILIVSLIVSGLGFYGLSLGIIGAVLAYTSIGYREWLSKQRGYQFRLSKLPGMASSSPTTLAIATIGYSVPLSLLSWSFLLGSFSNSGTIATAAIMGIVGIVLLFGWLIKGWGLKLTQQVEPVSVSAANESWNSPIKNSSIIDYFRQHLVAAILIPIALLIPLCCCLSGAVIGPIVVPPTPTPTPVTPTLTPTPITPTLTLTATLIPSATITPSISPTYTITPTLPPKTLTAIAKFASQTGVSATRTQQAAFAQATKDARPATATFLPTSPPVTGFDRNGDGRVTCADFSTRAQAKKALDAGYTNLDTDHDGIPCESLP